LPGAKVRNNHQRGKQRKHQKEAGNVRKVYSGIIKYDCLWQSRSYTFSLEPGLRAL
jgi:hypothetical protein